MCMNSTAHVSVNTKRACIRISECDVHFLLIAPKFINDVLHLHCDHVSVSVALIIHLQ